MVLLLTMTSLTFLIPAVFASYKNLYIPSRILFLLSLASANYWRNPCPGLRYKMDIIMARTSFVYFFIQGVTKVKDPTLQLIGYPTIALSLYCYKKAAHLNNNGNSLFVPYHMVFHLTTIVVQSIIVSCLS
jgi:hypothetical protein